MKCFVCQRDISGPGVLLNADGDFACCEECRQRYEKDKKHFFDHIIHDPELCERWLLGANL